MILAGRQLFVIVSMEKPDSAVLEAKSDRKQTIEHSSKHKSLVLLLPHNGLPIINAIR
jgi:hypothetical protein